jgi:hypothetical protein
MLGEINVGVQALPCPFHKHIQCMSHTTAKRFVADN